MKFLIFSIIFVIFAIIKNCSSQCGRNEEWSDCGRNFCTYHCDHLISPEACRAACGPPGCVCKSGFYLHKGACISAEECPQRFKCLDNEEYVACTNVSTEKTCSNSVEEYNPYSDCQSRCLCKAGYIRDSDNVCVKPEECFTKTRCGLNERYLQCSYTCREETCDTPEETCQTSSDGFFIRDGFPLDFPCRPKCYCKNGYVRNAQNICIKYSDCPPFACGENERYERCSRSCEDVTCTGKTSFCSYICKPKCLCKFGYVRNAENKCVRVEDCPQLECGQNQEWYTCAYKCDKLSCYDKSSIYPCVNDILCTPGCHCKKGFYKDVAHQCIPERSCPKRRVR